MFLWGFSAGIAACIMAGFATILLIVADVDGFRKKSKN